MIIIDRNKLIKEKGNLNLDFNSLSLDIELTNDLIDLITDLIIARIKIDNRYE